MGKKASAIDEKTRRKKYNKQYYNKTKSLYKDLRVFNTMISYYKKKEKSEKKGDL